MRKRVWRGVQRRLRGNIPITHQLAMNDQLNYQLPKALKLQHNQQVRRIALLVNTFLRNVAGLPQVIIDVILKDLRSLLYVQPLRPLTLTLPPNLQLFGLNPLDTTDPLRSYNRGEDPVTRRSPFGPGIFFGRLGYGTFQ